MHILAIETATRAASVAVIFDGKILAESSRESPQTFSGNVTLHPMGLPRNVATTAIHRTQTIVLDR